MTPLLCQEDVIGRQSLQFLSESSVKIILQPDIVRFRRVYTVKLRSYSYHSDAKYGRVRELSRWRIIDGTVIRRKRYVGTSDHI